MSKTNIKQPYFLEILMNNLILSLRQSDCRNHRRPLIGTATIFRDCKRNTACNGTGFYVADFSLQSLSLEGTRQNILFNRLVNLYYSFPLLGSLYWSRSSNLVSPHHDISFIFLAFPKRYIFDDSSIIYILFVVSS